jgi:hypothetical protein
MAPVFGCPCLLLSKFALQALVLHSDRPIDTSGYQPQLQFHGRADEPPSSVLP